MTEIKIRSNYQDHTIKLDDILFIEALSDYVIIRMNGGEKYTTLHTMKDMVNKLCWYGFSRSHRSYIVNLDKIKSVKGDVIQIVDGEKRHLVPVGRRFKYEFRDSIRLST